MYGIPARAAALATASSPSKSRIRLKPVWGEDDWDGHWTSKQRRPRVDLANLAEDSWAEPPVCVDGRVLSQGDLVLGSAIDVSKTPRGSLLRAIRLRSATFAARANLRATGSFSNRRKRSTDRTVLSMTYLSRCLDDT